MCKGVFEKINPNGIRADASNPQNIKLYDVFWLLSAYIPKGILKRLLTIRLMAAAIPTTKAFPPEIELIINIAKIGEMRPHPV